MQSRPLLKTSDPGATLRKLMAERDPIYALADLIVESRDEPHDRIVDDIVRALHLHLVSQSATASVPGIA